ncbi:phosphoribosylanthranilate isomerase [Dyadobacter jejuensis]|uniref:N-(5'-phosphoribosyl)anthranilate isomerase n=1 Tax=Dyadobacter jejuensis TaxID=1082580 RepID=A0A316ABY0_9BACT|nr:phosphoribosylanthranilate isomerase [Dyadobacter jejuensis]PWJ55286.1 phosphoribosylanthranilate isomerase [Dyadobacter jejuensis]
MKIKVCGMRVEENIAELIKLLPNYIGFIFYEKSPRFVGEELDPEFIRNIPQDISKVGVFVNANPGFILETVKKYDLQYAQLHGQEMPDMCRILRQKGINIIKAFSIDNSFNFAMLNNYAPHCDLFLFDTKGDQPGGNGVPFDWSLLKKYDHQKPFLIGGGISLDNIHEVVSLSVSLPIYGIDVNSQFEVEPGNKDLKKLEQLFDIVRIKQTQEAQA